MLGVVVTHPLKVIRYCQQTGDQTIRITARGIFQSRGFTGFYRGLPPELSLTVLRGLVGWPIMVKGSESLEPYIPDPYVRQVLIGSIVALFDGIVTTPWEQKKIRRAVDAPLSTHRWQGLPINCAHRWVKLIAFLMAQQYFSQKQPEQPTLGERLKVGLQVTGAVALVSTPFDRTHTLIQAGLSSSSKRPSWRGMLLYMLPLGINTMLSSLFLETLKDRSG
ncbi:MAG: hypothetical protein KGR16_05615 [Verrucomicrobia bacterium]|nr:hypothetical protein [Verrucomicrobiota bacterium]MDE3047739.1 hypothetical protein [Verrucomicrobiota bacterium]